MSVATRTNRRTEMEMEIVVDNGGGGVMMMRSTTMTLTWMIDVPFRSLPIESQ